MLRKQCVKVSMGFISSRELLIRQEWTVSGDQEPLSTQRVHRGQVVSLGLRPRGQGLSNAGEACRVINIHAETDL